MHFQEWVTMAEGIHVDQKQIAVANLYFYFSLDNSGMSYFGHSHRVNPSPPDQNRGPAWPPFKTDVASSLNNYYIFSNTWLAFWFS